MFRHTGIPVGARREVGFLRVYEDKNKTANRKFGACEKKIGWGGRIRTFTGLINSEVPYQLDHAPAASAAKTWQHVRR
jgi:hypothetical protein